MKYLPLLLLTGCVSTIRMADTAQPLTGDVIATITCNYTADCYYAAANMCLSGYAVLAKYADNDIQVKCNHPH